MVIDPVRRNRDYTFETPLTLDLADPLVRLAALPPSLDAPYLTVSLDWRPDFAAPGRRPALAPARSQRRARRDPQTTSQRPSRQQFARASTALLAGLGPRGVAFDSVTADIARIQSYLDGELDPAAQGVFIVACDATGVFEPLALGLPVPTALSAGPTPALSTLARLDEDHPTYAVLVADQRDAYLTFITQATRDKGVYLESTLYPRKQQQGGWSQRRYQARADQRVFHFARVLAHEVQRALDETGVDLLIVAGDEVITSALAAEWAPAVAERLAATIRLDIGAPMPQVIDATLPLAAEAERAREAAAVHRLRETLGGGRAVAGAVDVLDALRSSQVGLLMMTDDFAVAGWADYGLSLVGVGPVPAAHPVGGDTEALVSIRLEEEFVRIGVQTGAEIEVVHAANSGGLGVDQPTSAADALNEVGGVGGLLRFAMGAQHPEHH
jgi:hypothetical protein